MTPAARAQAAIELIGLIEQSISARGQPADRIIHTYFKARRYAGSRDRAQVTEQVFGVLRRRAQWLWRSDGEAPPSPRLMIAAELTTGGEAVADLFDGSDYGPAALSADEDRALAKMCSTPATAPPDWVAGNFPEWLQPDLEARFGSDIGPEMSALNDRAPLDLRVNTLKSQRQQALEGLASEGVTATPTELSPMGLRVTGRSRITGLKAFTGGAFDIQDEGSQVACVLAQARPGMQVVDLCAGAGGKTLALAAAMENKGQIYAVDNSRHRLRQMKPRLGRAGVRNVQTRRADVLEPAALSDLSKRADRVVLDAPCTGTGAWRRNPDARWRLTPDMLSHHTERQDRLLDRAAELVAPGGRLIYVTCSVLPQENEQRVEAFLARTSDFVALPVTEVWRDGFGTEFPGQAQAGPYLFLTPHRHQTDGFFVAVLSRAPRPHLDLAAGEM